MKNKFKTRSKVRAVLVGALALAFVGASAASFGGLNSDTLGSEDDIVASCDTDGITVSYSYAYDTAAQYYEVTAVNLSSVNVACDGLDASVSLADGTTLLTTQTRLAFTLATNAFTITLSTPVQAELVDSVSLIIS